MDDLRDRFATLDRLPVPDVWRDVERRLEALGTTAPTGQIEAVRPDWHGVAPADRPAASAGIHRDRRVIALLAAAALITALVVGGAIAVGSGLLRQSSVVPPLPSPSAPAPSRLTTPRSAAWSPTGSMASERVAHTATVLGDGKVLVSGGFVCCLSIAGAELYDPGTGTWTATGSLGTARRFHTASLLDNGKVLVAGGMGTGQDAGGTSCCVSIAGAELYDPITGTWSSTGSMTVSRHRHTATVLADGKVLVAGGSEVGPQSQGGGSYGGHTLATAELYDPDTGAWRATGSMSTARDGHTAVLLVDGRVLVAGGEDGEQPAALTSAELFDPRTGTWSAVGGMATGRIGHTATMLGDGTVLVAGGTGALLGSEFSASAELYYPSTATWSATGSMSISRTFHSAVVMGDGKVLVAGGGDLQQTASDLFDPATGTWTAAPSMASTRSAHTAVRLPDGRVLVAGGERFDPHDWLDSAELYAPGSGS